MLGQKSEEVYDLVVCVIACKSGFVITDGDATLIRACKHNFKECISFQCTSHFKESCTRLLKSIEITGDSKQGPFPDIVFGEQGFTEVENKYDLEKRIKKAESIIDEMEKSLLQLDNKSPVKLSTYLKE